MNEDWNNKLRLQQLTIYDLHSMLAIRNDIQTRSQLHHQNIYSLDEAIKWFTQQKPIWFSIKEESTQHLLGYIRTSDLNYIDRSIYIGCDIHPNFRRKGIATWAYKTFLDRLWKRGWQTAKLKVIKSNSAALHLYENLGFSIIEHESDSFIMKKDSPIAHTNKNVKVIASYFGDKRRYPSNAKEAYKMYKFLVNNELKLEYGLPLDTIIVNNKLMHNDIGNRDDILICEQFLNTLNGASTKNGVIKVESRENIGLSFGAYNHAFSHHRHEYDFWFFTEDDQIIIADNVLQNCVKTLLDIRPDKQIGFVATVGINSYIGPSALGGCGVTSQRILNEVYENNFSNILQSGCLPYWHTLQRGAEGHNYNGDVRFTQIIHKLGYALVDCEQNDIAIGWGQCNKRTPRLVPFEHWMSEL